MRCVVRLIILTCAAFIFLIYCAVSHANSKIIVAFDANDEEARRILENAIPSPTASNSNSISLSNSSKPQSLSVSVALVLIVSLISVALLITGIIIIAVTLDPSSSTEEDDESDLETDENLSSDPKTHCSSRFDYSLLTEL